MFPLPPPDTTEESVSPKKESPPAQQRKRSIVVVTSRVANQSLSPEDQDGVETEITAQIIVPEEGGWGWVVVAAAFMNIFFIDGVVFTFGCIYAPITEDLQMEQSVVGFINSIMVTLYYGCGPPTSALINRFGFRAVSMAGAVICMLSLVCTHYSSSFAAICLFYGGFSGVGFSFINLSSNLVAGFYFEKLRSLVLAIAASGSSAGVMVMFPFNSYLVSVSSWRSLTLLHAGFMGLVYFMSMAFQPLLTVTVSKAAEDTTRTVTYLPSVHAQPAKPAPSKYKSGALIPTHTEKAFGAVNNYNYPTAAAVLDDTGIMLNVPNQVAVAGPSTTPVSKLTITANTPKSGISQRHLKQVHSMISKTGVHDRMLVELRVKEEVQTEKPSCWARLCQWEDDVPQSRPMYRDDVFYDGKMETLPAYQKSRMDTEAEKTGLEYQLAVTRAVSIADLQERKGVCTTAARRILVTMMDPSLLRRVSFLMISVSSFFIYLGILVPYIFIKDRNLEAGIDEMHCNWFVSVIGLTSAIGRLVLGALAVKINPLILFIASFFISGTSLIIINFSYNVYYQYLCCSIYGFFISSVTGLRSMVLVQLYGLDKLTNATGMLLLFQGIACCISTPGATIVRESLGFSYTFYFAGFFICLSGVLLLPIKYFCAKEQTQLDFDEKQKAPLSPQTTLQAVVDVPNWPDNLIYYHK